MMAPAAMAACVAFALALLVHMGGATSIPPGSVSGAELVYSRETIPMPYSSPRRSSVVGWHNMRILVDYSYMSSALARGTANRNFVEQTLLPSAIQFIQNVYRVRDTQHTDVLDPKPKLCKNNANSATCGCVHDTITGAVTSVDLKPEHFKIINPTSGYDYVLYVTSAGIAQQGVLAYALTCRAARTGLPGRGRPIVGIYNINPAAVDSSSAQWDHQLTTAVHEITHALGFAGSTFPKFTDPTTGLALKAGTVVKKFEVMGANVSKIVTPKLKAAVSNQFACKSVFGGELENQGDAGSAGSHWERRVYGNEIMTSTISNTGSVYSVITMSAMEDSGWYKPDYTMAGPLQWGHKDGCDLLQKPCLTGNKASPTITDKKLWCSEPKKKGCSANRRFMGECAIGVFNASLGKEYKIPSRFSYFTDPQQGGMDYWTDFCPYTRAYPNRECTAIKAPAGAKADSYGGSYSANSRCFDTTLKTLIGAAGTGQGCYETACEYKKDTTSGTIKPHLFVKIGSVWARCKDKGGDCQVGGFTGKLQCPKAEEVCLHDMKKCVDDCNGHGDCDGNTGLCKCKAGWTGRTCSECVGKAGCTGLSAASFMSVSSGMCMGVATSGVPKAVPCGSSTTGWTFTKSSGGLLKNSADDTKCLVSKIAAPYNLNVLPCNTPHKTSGWDTKWNANFDGGQSVMNGLVVTVTSISPSENSINLALSHNNATRSFSVQTRKRGSKCTKCLNPSASVSKQLKDCVADCDYVGEQQFAVGAFDPIKGTPIAGGHMATSTGLLYTKTKPNAAAPSSYKSCECGWECDPSKALCDAYGGIQYFLNIGLAVCGVIFLIVGYRFKSQVLFMIGFVLGAMVVFPFAFMLLYQRAPTENWPLIVALVISCMMGIFFGLLSKIRCVGNTTIGVLTGCLVGYVLYIVFLQLPLNASNDAKNGLFGAIIFVFAVVFAILSWWTESAGHERAHRHFMCFCASFLGAFLILKGAGFLIVTAANDYAFPDSFGAYCSCLTKREDCAAYKYACKYDDDAATCKTAGAHTLDNLDMAGGVYLIIMAVLTAIFWPFQDKVTSDWCGANDEEFDGREEELQREEDELHALAAKIKKMPKGPEKDDAIVDYKKRKSQYEEDRAITIELEKSRGDTSHHHAEISHSGDKKKDSEGKTAEV